MAWTLSVLALVLSLAVGDDQVRSSRIVTEESVLAVVTHKGGIAAGLAHDHLVTAGEPILDLDFDANSPTGISMELKIEASDLIVDDPESRRRWSPRLTELGILEEALGEIPEKQRKKIRQSMLGQRQLAADEFPTILARIVDVRTTDGTGSSFFTFGVNLALTVRGQTVTRSVSAGYTVAGDRVTIEAFGSFRFTDFGIKPYSAMLGAVKNQDEFHVYIFLILSNGEEP